MNIYLAAPWAHKETAREVAAVLEAEGFTIVSRWLREHSNSPDHTELQHEALNDIEDIDQSDSFVLLNLGKSEGKATELGYAYARAGFRYKLIVVGPSTGNVFYHLPGVHIVETIERAITLLNSWP